MPIEKPEVLNTAPHREARDTAIGFLSRNPMTSQPPANVPLYGGQLAAVQINATQARLYVGSDDASRWLQVVV